MKKSRSIRQFAILATSTPYLFAEYSADEVQGSVCRVPSLSNLLTKFKVQYAVSVRRAIYPWSSRSDVPYMFGEIEG